MNKRKRQKKIAKHWNLRNKRKKRCFQNEFDTCNGNTIRLILSRAPKDEIKRFSFENAEARISRVLTMQNIERIESTNSRLSRPLTVKRVEGRKEGRTRLSRRGKDTTRDRQIARPFRDEYFWEGKEQ